MAIQVATGYNNTAGLTNLVPEPRLTGILRGRWLVRGDGLGRADGKMRCELIWDFALAASSSTYWDDFVFNNILSQFGLSASTPSVPITIALPGNILRTNINYNGIANLPDLPSEGTWDRRKLLNLRIPITGLVTI